MSSIETVEKYLTDNAGKFEEELTEFLKIPSVSADSQFAESVRDCAKFVHQGLVDAGLEAEIVETAGHPIVFGHWRHAEGAPTVLVYGHYDVQPPDPLELWETGPFEPTVRGEHIYARGATDDKGQMWTHVKSVEAWLKTEGKLPVNVIFVIEGEEEVGSDNLDIFLEANKEKLKCDVVVVSDTSQYAPGIPAVTYGLRGILACEITVHGPNRDLHSGVFGGAIANPANVLAKMIGQLHDDNGKIQIPNFYDDIIPLTEEERAAFAALPFDERAFLDDLGVAEGAGEDGFSTTERRWARPTCDVNGMVSGYTGEGPKTIVPAKASVKITCRLVPGQSSKKMTQALNDYMQSLCPSSCRMEFVDFHGCDALVFDPNSPFMKCASNAIEVAFGAAPVMIREGGSIPVVKSFRDLLKVDTLLLGWGQNSDNLHSPNEHFSLKDFQRGIHASARLWDELAK